LRRSFFRVFGIASILYFSRKDEISKNSKNFQSSKKILKFFEGLRLHDNEALYHAVTTSQVSYKTFANYCKLPIFQVVFPIYILDVDWQTEKEKFSALKTRFLIECLRDLDEGLKKCGTRLYVLTGDATTVIKKFCKENEITQMTWMKDAEIFYRERDEEITKVVHRMEIKTKSFLGHTLYDQDEVIAKNGGKIPMDLSEFYAAIADMEQPGAPCPTVTAKHFKLGSKKIIIFKKSILAFGGKLIN